MSIRKFLGLVMVIFMVNLLGCATSSKKTSETGLKEFKKLPTATREKIVYPKESEPEGRGFSALKEKIKEHLPLKKTQTSEKMAVVKEKPRPHHIVPVKDIQTALKNAGYYTGNIDGKIGPKTDSAIKTFQKDNGLKVDGVVGQKTWNLLSKYSFIQEGVAIKGKEEVPIIQPLVPTEDIGPSTIARIPAVSTPSMEETPAVEETPSIVVETPIAKRDFTPLIVIIIIVLVIILAISIYRRRRI